MNLLAGLWRNRPANTLVKTLRINRLADAYLARFPVKRRTPSGMVYEASSVPSSPIFDIEHLRLFSPRGARAPFERAGFVDVEVRPILNRYPLQYWAKLSPFPRMIKGGCLAALNATGLGRLPIPMAVGNMAVIGYK
jgi:hypothetical protein